MPRWQGRTLAGSAGAPGGQRPAVLLARGSPLRGSVPGLAVGGGCGLTSGQCLSRICGLCIRGSCPAGSSAHAEHRGSCGLCLGGYVLRDLTDRAHASGG